MPYGLKGGDTPAKDAKAERGIKEIMAHGHSKVSAIKIYKAGQAKAAKHHEHRGHK